MTSVSVKTASSSRATTGTVKVKTAISTPAKRHVSSSKKRTPVGTRKTVVQSKAKAVFIDLTLSSDSSDDEDGTGPTAPRNTRRPSSTAVASSGSSMIGSSSRSASRSDEDSQEEAMLERMLMRHADSDMDLGSSDVEDGEIAMDLGSDEDEDDSDESDMDLGSENSYLRVYG